MASTPAVGPRARPRARRSAPRPVRGCCASTTSDPAQAPAAPAAGKRRHAAGQRRDRQHARRHQRGGHGDDEGQRDAGRGDGHGAPGLTRDQPAGSHSPRAGGRKSDRKRPCRPRGSRRVEQQPGPELGGHQQRATAAPARRRAQNTRPSQAGSRSGALGRCDHGGAHVRAARNVLRDGRTRRPFGLIGSASPPAAAWHSLLTSGRWAPVQLSSCSCCA